MKKPGWVLPIKKTTIKNKKPGQWVVGSANPAASQAAMDDFQIHVSVVMLTGKYIRFLACGSL